MADLFGHTPAIGDLYVVAGIVQAIESGTLVIVPGPGYVAVRVAEGQVARLSDLGGGGGGGAPTDAQYLVAAGNATLSAERVTTDTATVTWDHGTAGQAKANVPDATTTAKGVVELATSGEASAGVVVQGNDARLSNARTPTAHAASHSTGGADQVTVPIDNIDLGGLTFGLLGNHSGSDNAEWVTLDNDAALTAASASRVPTQQAVKSYVDSLTNGLRWKASARAATTANITLSGAQTIDGVSVVAGDRVLVKNQSTASENGIYVAASGSWTRATDFDTSAEARSAACFVEQGTVAADTGWVCTTEAITLNTTALAFAQFTTAGYTAGAGLTLTGSAFSIGAGQVVGSMIASATIDLTAKVTGALPISNGGTGQATQTAAMDALSPTTTKGDLLADNGTSVVRLAVGANESIPIADSAASAGITWVLCDVETRWILFDDCFWASLPNGGWTQGSSGTGTSAASSTFGVDSTEKAQGVVALSTGTDAGTGRSSFYQCLNSLLLGQGTAFEYEARVCLSNLSTAAQEFVVHFGFIDNANASSEPADGAYFVYRRATDGDFWVCCTRSNSTETKTVTATEPSASAFAIFKIVVAGDGASVKFYINGAEVASHSANIPTGAGRYTGIGQRIYKTNGSTARLVYFDWVRIKATGSAR